MRQEGQQQQLLGTTAPQATSGYSGSSRGQTTRPGPARCVGDGGAGRCAASWGAAAWEQGKEASERNIG